MEQSSTTRPNYTNSHDPVFDETSNVAMPTAAILCLAMGAYVIVVIVALAVRRCLNKNEACTSAEGCVRPSLLCSTCLGWRCKSFSCGCCTTCKDKKMHCCCEDCRCPNICSKTCIGRPLLDCARCDCTCSCQLPECKSINCCCFKIQIKS